MTDINNLITDNIDVWTNAIKKRNSQGRGSSKRIELIGIKKLRELILELAFSGKLVPNIKECCDHEANLQKMAVEKEAFHAKKGVRLQKFKSITDEFELPSISRNWQSVYFDQIITYITDFQANGSFSTLKKNVTYFSEENYALLVRLTDLRHGLSDSNGFKYTDKKGFDFLSKSSIDGGELVVANVGAGVGTTLEIPEINRPATLAPNMFMVVLSKLIVKRYFLYFSQSPVYKRYIELVNSGTGQPKINKTEYKNCKFPLAPLDEQHLIVAKVDELMALCDQLEQQTEQSLLAHQTLVEALLNTLTQSVNADDFQESWQRIADHFDVLFTTEASIDQLKQTILQLAVMGKLVAQNPSDEPASILLEKLAFEQKSWLESNLADNVECKTMLRKLNKLKSANAPFLLPKSWACVHLIQTTQLLVDCHNKTAPYTDSGIPIIRTTNIREREFRFDGLKYVNEETYDYWSRRCPPKSGDIMFTREAPMGEAAIIPEDVKWCLGQRTMLIRPMNEYVSNKFILLALTEPHLLERASEHAVGLTVKHLRVGDVENLNIPLPPLAEQYRIVAKVDELMALCDQLKVRLADVQTTQLHLADAVVENALN